MRAMLFAVFALLLWTVAGFSSAQSARIAGSLRANRWRLLLACGPLLVLGPLLSAQPLLPGIGWFVLGGILHLGLGDIGLFAAYRRLGPRLGLLICACLIPILAGIIEWLWLGVRPTGTEIILALVVLAAVVFALAPVERLRIERGQWWPGIAAAVCAATGQAMGAVVTRKGFAVNADAGAMETAFWRVGGGALVLVIIAAFAYFWRQQPAPVPREQRLRLGKWLLLSVTLGPVIGIPCYQMALSQVPAALVHAVLAALPLTIIPLAWWIEGDQPSWRALLGGVVAVCATAAMILSPLL